MEISKEKVEELFENAENQYEILIGLYKMVYPNWDKIKSVKGWPQLSKEAHTFISGKFIEFDQIHHPEVLNGGLWMNNGFGCDEDLEGWEVKPAPVELV